VAVFAYCNLNGLPVTLFVARMPR